MQEKYTKLFTVYESPLALISRRVSAYTSLRLYECPLHLTDATLPMFINVSEINV